jgi:glycosyltransferase involved in cell wall biosynthesis
MKLKLFTLAPQENWCVDEMVKQWRNYSGVEHVSKPVNADLIWLLADWCFDQIPYTLLKHKKVVTTVHHLVPEKCDLEFYKQWTLRDLVTDFYHVFNKHTEAQVRQLTSKPVWFIGYWYDQIMWRKLEDTNRIPGMVFSAQRDTEASSIQAGSFLPKLEKGPDLLCDYLEKQKNIDIHLAGPRRQYVERRLRQAKLNFVSHGIVTQEQMNKLYNEASLYVVASRYEGGPQALLECGAAGCPVISRDVGIASQVLPPSAVNDDLTKCIPAVPNVKGYTMQERFPEYERFFKSL